MEYFEEIQDRVILIGVQANLGDDMEESLDELGELAATAGAYVAGRIIQNREAIHPGTYIGKGKIEEVKGLLYALNANGVICDDELSPAQMNNLERELECKVMDRTLLILDIFAKRAVTSEGKIQVELAQLRYRSARLVGLRSSLSRLGGGIGTRGPGEKKLETDRRLIRNRISALKQELSQVEKHRELLRSRRAAGNLKTAAIVGYTNAGKSTLLNTLTGASVLSEDKLFATLDPTTRLLTLDDGQQLLLTDTVGFIRKLPHNLVEACVLEHLFYLGSHSRQHNLYALLAAHHTQIGEVVYAGRVDKRHLTHTDDAHLGAVAEVGHDFLKLVAGTEEVGAVDFVHLHAGGDGEVLVGLQSHVGLVGQVYLVHDYLDIAGLSHTLHEEQTGDDEAHLDGYG